MHLIEKIKPISRRVKAANLKLVKKLLNDIIATIVPLQISPMFTHLVSYKNLGKVSTKSKEIGKIAKLPKRLKKEKKLGFACGTCGTKFTSMKKVNDHSSIEHPILNLACKELACEYKTNNAQSLQDHKKELHERNICKNCNTITIGTAHKENHEKIVHENEIVMPHLHVSKETPAQRKGWVQPKNNFYK